MHHFIIQITQATNKCIPAWITAIYLCVTIAAGMQQARKTIIELNFTGCPLQLLKKPKVLLNCNLTLSVIVTVIESFI